MEVILSLLNLKLRTIRTANWTLIIVLGPRSSSLGQGHKNMSSQGTPFVSASNYFHPHQSHLQQFTSFANPVQSASATNPYSHSMLSVFSLGVFVCLHFVI